MRSSRLMASATRILNLRHQMRVVRAHRRSPTRKTGTIIRIAHHHLLQIALTRQQIQWLGDEHRGAAARTISVVNHELVGDLAAGHVAGRHGRVHQSVTQRHVPQT